MSPAKKSLPDLGAVDSRDLTSQVVERLRQALVSSAIAPGDHLVEFEIADQMGVSRAPVREAIRVLDQEGLVEFFPYRGAVAIGMTESEIAVCYELRAVIEANAAEAAMAADLAGLVARLTEIIGAMERDRASDTETMTAHDIEFHHTIVASSGYRYLERKWQSLDGLMRVRNMQSLERPGEISNYWRRTFVSSHAQILDAISTGDTELAQAEVREHLLAVAPLMQSGPTHQPD